MERRLPCWRNDVLGRSNVNPRCYIGSGRGAQQLCRSDCTPIASQHPRRRQTAAIRARPAHAAASPRKPRRRLHLSNLVPRIPVSSARGLAGWFATGRGWAGRHKALAIGGVVCRPEQRHATRARRTRQHRRRSPRPAVLGQHALCLPNRNPATSSREDRCKTRACGAPRPEQPGASAAPGRRAPTPCIPAHWRGPAPHQAGSLSAPAPVRPRHRRSAAPRPRSPEVGVPTGSA